EPCANTTSSLRDGKVPAQQFPETGEASMTSGLPRGTAPVPRGVAPVPPPRAAQIASYLPIPTSGIPASAPPAPPAKPIVPPNGPAARMPSVRLPEPSDRIQSQGKLGFLEWLPEQRPPQPTSVRVGRNASLVVALMLLAAAAGMAYLLSVEPRY